MPAKFSDPRDLDADLIAYLCRKASGVGDTTARTLAGLIGTAAVFAQADANFLLQAKTLAGRPLLSPAQAATVIAVRDRFLPSGSSDVRELWITALIRDFVENAIAEINSTDFDKLLINPFLIRAFNFTDHREVIRFCFYQKVTRSIVTSWGFVVQDMLIVTGHPFDETGYTQKVLQWASVELPKGSNIGTLLENKEEQIRQDWESRYGTGPESIERFCAATLAAPGYLARVTLHDCETEQASIDIDE